MFKLSVKRKKRHILHIDADAFFASVEQVLNPNLKGKALLVGSPGGKKGIVSAASYEAKKFGIYSGMPIYLAKKKCPHAVIVGGHFEAYGKFSKEMYAIFCKYTPAVEMVSIDEAYLDITGCCGFLKRSAKKIAETIMFDIYKSLGISVSCGLSSNKIVSKVASSTNKPHKLTVVPFGSEAKFLAPLSLGALPGIGPKTLAVLNRHGFEKVGDIAKLKANRVFEIFGVQGIPIWKKCLGIDNSEVSTTDRLPKSISKERTFYAPIGNDEICLNVLKDLSIQVFEKLRSHNMKAKTVFVKIRYKKYENGKWKFDDYSFQKHLGIYGCCDSELFPVAKDIFLKNFLANEQIRLIGVGVCNLRQQYNLNLFGRESKHKENLFKSVDLLNKVHGKSTVRYGA